MLHLQNVRNYFSRIKLGSFPPLNFQELINRYVSTTLIDNIRDIIIVPQRITKGGSSPIIFLTLSLRIPMFSKSLAIFQMFNFLILIGFFKIIVSPPLACCQKLESSLCFIGTYSPSDRFVVGVEEFVRYREVYRWERVTVVE